MPSRHSAVPELASPFADSSAGELIPELGLQGLLQLIKLEITSMLSDSRQQPWAKLLAIMEYNDNGWIVCMFKELVRSCLTLDSPANGMQGC